MTRMNWSLPAVSLALLPSTAMNRGQKSLLLAAGQLVPLLLVLVNTHISWAAFLLTMVESGFLNVHA